MIAMPHHVVGLNGQSDTNAHFGESVSLWPFSSRSVKGTVRQGSGGKSAGPLACPAACLLEPLVLFHLTFSENKSILPCIAGALVEVFL